MRIWAGLRLSHKIFANFCLLNLANPSLDGGPWKEGEQLHFILLSVFVSVCVCFVCLLFGGGDCINQRFAMKDLFWIFSILGLFYEKEKTDKQTGMTHTLTKQPKETWDCLLL